jgi:hypothetical protein
LSEAVISRETLKQALKEALAETLNEQRELFREVLVEVLEDFALIEAIEAGRGTERVERSRIFSILECDE